MLLRYSIVVTNNNCFRIILNSSSFFLLLCFIFRLSMTTSGPRIFNWWHSENVVNPQLSQSLVTDRFLIDAIHPTSHWKCVTRTIYAYDYFVDRKTIFFSRSHHKVMAKQKQSECDKTIHPTTSHQQNIHILLHYTVLELIISYLGMFYSVFSG